MSAAGFYGEAPADLGPVDLPDWHEFMHYLYLPIRIPMRDGGSLPSALDDVTLPPRLEFLRGACYEALDDALKVAPHFEDDPYVYLTTRRGFATPGNPLNRPGWHTDDFGGTDLNYIWCDRFPTRFVTAPGALHLPDDDLLSMEYMERAADSAEAEERHRRAGVATTGEGIRIEEATVGHMLRLTPHVIHDTPVIPDPGGMRSFFKISVSTHRYNLLGNSHNYELDYDWPMFDRAAVRNQPEAANTDHVAVP